MNLWILVPVKPFAEAKRRLASQIDPEQRALLAADLLHRTVTTLRAWSRTRPVVLVSRDPAVAEVANRYAVRFVHEPACVCGSPCQEERLNGALEYAAGVASAEGADGILVLPTDLPFLGVDDLRELTAAAAAHTLVLAPSHTGGTNAMVLSPPDLVPFGFGEKSFERHRQSALDIGAGVTVIRRPGLAFDLDFPDDLRRYESAATGSAARKS